MPASELAQDLLMMDQNGSSQAWFHINTDYLKNFDKSQTLGCIQDQLKNFSGVDAAQQ